MDLLQHVRDLRTDEVDIDATHTRRPRSALLEAIDAERGAPTARRRPMRRLNTGQRWGFGIGGAGLVAGAAAVVAIVAGTVVAPPPQAVLPAAAAVFAQAAESVRLEVAEYTRPLQAGQYLRVETTLEQVHTDGWNSMQPAESAAFTMRRVSVLYVPADRSDDWILDTKPIEIVAVFGPNGQSFLEGVAADSGEEATGVVAYPEGIRVYGDHAQPIDMWRESYDAMPRDPAALLAWFERHTSGATFSILNALYENLPPADLRASLLEALALTGEFSVQERNGTRVTLTRNVQAGDTAPVVQEFVIDVSTGEIVEFRNPQAYPSELVPSDLYDSRESFDISVVDEAPQPTRPADG